MCPCRPRVTAENATYLLTKALRMSHLLNLDAFAGVLPDGSNGTRPEPHHLLAPMTQALVHSTSNGEAARPHPVETTGWLPLGPDEGLPPWCTKLLSITDTLVVLCHLKLCAKRGWFHSARLQPLALSGALSMTLTHHQLRRRTTLSWWVSGPSWPTIPVSPCAWSKARTHNPLWQSAALPLSANLLCAHPLSPWIAAGEPAEVDRQHVLEAAGARILRLPMNARGHVNLTALLERLGELGINSVMVEGGARIITSSRSGWLTILS